MAESREKSDRLRSSFEQEAVLRGLSIAYCDRKNCREPKPHYFAWNTGQTWEIAKWAWEAGRRDALEEQWISVEEKLPDIGEFVWVVIDGGVQCTAAVYTGDEWYWSDEDADATPTEAVSHWMSRVLPPCSKEPK